MAIEIPARNDPAWGAIVEAFGKFTKEQIIPMDVNKVEDKDSTKKVQVAAKFFLSLADRPRIKQQVISYLEDRLDDGETFAREIQTIGNWGIDLVVRYNNEKEKKSPQVVRVELKPIQSGGSRGGSSNTTVQEVGMAAFLALRLKRGQDLECHPDASNPEQCLTPEDYAEGISLVKTKDKVKPEQLEALEQEWKDTFITGANKIANEGNITGNDWEVVRNDDTLEKMISDKFKNVVKKDPDAHLAEENKWNPSDIWLLRNRTTILELLSREETTDCLNNFLQLAFSDVDIPTKATKKVPRRSLIGISLKKLGPQSSLKTINAMDTQGLIKREKVGFDKNATTSRLRSFSSMDVYFNYASGKNQSFQARNFAGQAKGDWKFELQGEYAAQGKMQGTLVREVLERAGTGTKNKWGHKIPEEADKKFTNGAECTTSTDREASNTYDNIYGKGKHKKMLMNDKQVKITDEIYELLNEFSALGFKKGATNKKAMWTTIATKDASWRFSKVTGLRMLKWFTSLSKANANRAMKELYLYASSQADKSSVHYKLM